MRRFKKLQAIFFIVLNALISVIKLPRIPARYPNPNDSMDFIPFVAAFL